MTTLPSGHTLISTILRHDAKQTSHKIALLRAINDVVLAYPLSLGAAEGVAVPLRVLAEYWLAYYFPFVDPARPILQGPQAVRGGALRADMGFRAALTHFRVLWEVSSGLGGTPADGYLAVSELRRRHRRNSSGPAPALEAAYQRALQAIARTIEMPIRYAGPKGQEWSVFAKTLPYVSLAARTVALPGTQPADKCLLVPVALWESFAALSLWVEALCIHEWCLFGEQVVQADGTTVRRGVLYELLTARPDNRRPLTWERNQVDILLMEGAIFQCPWTQRAITTGTAYDLDHVIPLAVYPVNDLWNLVPTDPHYNQHVKRDRVPGEARLRDALPFLTTTYRYYQASRTLGPVLLEEAGLRFRDVAEQTATFESALANAVAGFVERVRTARNLATF